MINYFDDCSIWVEGLPKGLKPCFYSTAGSLETEGENNLVPQKLDSFSARVIATELWNKYTWIHSIEIRINQPTTKIFTILEEYGKHAEDYNALPPEKRMLKNTQ